jgi:hypothetical protein
MEDKLIMLLSKTIINLLNRCNHLSLQLDFECGNISKDYFDKEEPKYLLQAENITHEELIEDIKILFDFTKLPLDSNDISKILNCSVDEAEKVINIILLTK